MKKHDRTTSDAVKILHRRYIGDDVERKISLQNERTNAEVAQMVHDLRTDAGLTQKELAEKIGPKDFSELINRFFVKSAHVLTGYGAMIEKLVGDEVTAVFTSGTAGENYHGQSIEAAKDLLRQTGHGTGKKPWVKVGIGIHSGVAFLGSIGNPDGIMEVAALGDVPNTAARLTSMAGPGEILVSEFTIKAANLETEGLERRNLKLKGHEKEITAFVVYA